MKPFVGYQEKPLSVPDLLRLIDKLKTDQIFNLQENEKLREKGIIDGKNDPHVNKNIENKHLEYIIKYLFCIRIRIQFVCIFGVRPKINL